MPGIKEGTVTSPSDKPAVPHIMQNGEICLISMKLCGWKGCTSGHICVSEVKTLCAIHVFRSPGSFYKGPIVTRFLKYGCHRTQDIWEKMKILWLTLSVLLELLKFQSIYANKKSLKIHLHSMHPQVFKIEKNHLIVAIHRYPIV